MKTVLFLYALVQILIGYLGGRWSGHFLCKFLKKRNLYHRKNTAFIFLAVVLAIISYCLTAYFTRILFAKFGQ